MITAAAATVAAWVTSVVLTALIVTVLGDVVDHVRGARGLPTCRRAASALRAATGRLRRRTASRSPRIGSLNPEA